MENRNSILLFVCLLAIMVIGSAQLVLAQIVEVSSAQLTTEAQAIYKGKVKAMKSEWNDEKNFIWTFVTLGVSETIKGEEMKGKDVEIKIPGGEVGEIGQKSSDQVTFEQGEEAVVFLGKEKYKEKEYFNVIRMFLGKFTVKEGKIKDKPLESFLQEIKQALEQIKE
ncbi:MAG: hypothetical protein ACE5JB_04275 [bacterium]